MYATETERCPDKILKKYMSLRPAHACLPDSPFCLQPANIVSDSLWYKNQPVGDNSLCKFMRVMSENAGISGNKTNHSARKTMITKLVQKDTNPLHVAQLTGHKSIDSYTVASKTQQKQMSHVISGSSSHGPLKDVSNASSSSHQLPGMQITGNNTISVRCLSQVKPSLCLTLLHQERKDAKYIFKIVTMNYEHEHEL